MKIQEIKEGMIIPTEDLIKAGWEKKNEKSSKYEIWKRGDKIMLYDAKEQRVHMIY
jgi:hypothetical protein